jgi:hypothetical protein
MGRRPRSPAIVQQFNISTLQLAETDKRGWADGFVGRLEENIIDQSTPRNLQLALHAKSNYCSRNWGCPYASWRLFRQYAQRNSDALAGACLFFVSSSSSLIRLVGLGWVDRSPLAGWLLLLRSATRLLPSVSTQVACPSK